MSEVSAVVAIGLVCALLSAFATNLAFLLKHRGAIAAPDVDMPHPLRSARDLFRSRCPPRGQACCWSART